MKISDIFYEEKISYKYKHYNRYENRAIIEKIYAEKEEINIIKILELTFEELFIIFRRKLKDKEDMKKLEEIKDKIEGLDLEENNNKYLDIEYFIERIRQKDSIFYRSIMDEYIEKIKSLCLGYEEWFKNKNERSTKSG
jgi:restriction endonuclease Mrr